MIFAPVPSILMLVLIPLSLMGLILSVILLWFWWRSPQFRSRVRRTRKITLWISVPLLAMLSALAINILYTFWWVSHVVYAPESAHHVTLSEDMKIGEFELPAGTRLDLRDAYTYERDNIVKATFPHPVKILGIASTELSSSVYSYFEITPVADETIDGWRCQGGKPVRFRTRSNWNPEDGGDKPIAPRLERCILAAGNEVGGVAIPPGSTMGESDNPDYPHRSVDIGIFDEVILGDLHVPLRRACLTVNGSPVNYSLSALMRASPAHCVSELPLCPQARKLGTPRARMLPNIGLPIKRRCPSVLGILI